MKIMRPYTGKKEPTDPAKKETHLERKLKQEYLHHLELLDWEQQLKEYINENKSIQE